MKQPMKEAKCEGCGKRLGFVPADATDILCFKCNEAEMDKRDKQRK